jgi:hypothetical protein
MIHPATASARNQAWEGFITDDPLAMSSKFILVIGKKSKLAYFVTDRRTVEAVESVKSIGRSVLQNGNPGLYDNLYDAKFLCALMDAELKLQAHLEYHGWGSISVYDSLRDCNLEENCRFFRAYERGRDESRTQD